MYGDHEGEEEDPVKWAVAESTNGNIWLDVWPAESEECVSVMITRGMLKAMLSIWHRQYALSVSDSYRRATRGAD